MRRQLLDFGVDEEPLHNEEFVEQALHEEAVIQHLDKGMYTYSITSKCFQ